MRVWNPRFELGGLEERDLKEATFLLWKGHCSVHQRFRPEHVAAFRARVPGRRGDRAPRVRARRRRARRPGRLDRADPRVGRGRAAPGSVLGVGTEIHMVQRMAARAPRPHGRVARPADLPVLDDVPHRRPAPRVGARVARAGRGREPDHGRRATPPSGHASRSSACSTSPDPARLVHVSSASTRRARRGSQHEPRDDVGRVAGTPARAARKPGGGAGSSMSSTSRPELGHRVARSGSAAGARRAARPRARPPRCAGRRGGTGRPASTAPRGCGRRSSRCPGSAAAGG